MLEGLRRKNPKCADFCAPVTLEMLLMLIKALQSVCSSHYEAFMFSSAFSLSFLALLRVGEITADRRGLPGPYAIKCQDISFKLINGKLELQVKICSSKADQS